LVKWRPTYDKQFLITNYRCEFINDPRFRNAFDTAFKAGQGKVGSHSEWRTHFAVWAAGVGMHLEGEFVECGVELGHLSRTIMEYYDWKRVNKRFYLIDTYCGMDKRYMTPNDLTRELPYPDIYEFTKKAFSSFPNAIIVRGVVPDVLATLPEMKVAYLSIDMNTVIPEIAAAEYFWPRMSSGAILLHDDYGQQGFDEQRIGFDKFAKEKGVSILCSPTGQGMIIKP